MANAYRTLLYSGSQQGSSLPSSVVIVQGMASPVHNDILHVATLNVASYMIS